MVKTQSPVGEGSCTFLNHVFPSSVVINTTRCYNTFGVDWCYNTGVVLIPEIVGVEGVDSFLINIPYVVILLQFWYPLYTISGNYLRTLPRDTIPGLRL